MRTLFAIICIICIFSNCHESSSASAAKVQDNNSIDSLIPNQCYNGDTSAAFDNTLFKNKNVKEVRVRISTFKAIIGNSGLILFNFQNLSTSNVNITGRTLGSTQLYDLNFEEASNIPLGDATGFQFKPNILPQSVMVDFLQELSSESGFDFTSHPDSFRINFHPTLQTIDGTLNVVFDVQGVRLSDNALSTTKRKTNPCPPCN